MIKKLSFIALIGPMVIWGTNAFAAPGRSANTQCYVWAHNASPAVSTPYSPSATYSFNANGDAATYNSVTKTAKGNYTVTCKNVGGSGWAAAGGHVQVTAYGASSANCKINYWINNGADFNAYVKCYTPAGAAVDSQFDLLYMW
jgi:hypothetical protein